jgi:integrase
MRWHDSTCEGYVNVKGLQQRNGNWRIRVQVPSICREALGWELVAELNTKDYEEAKELARPILVEMHAKIEEARPKKKLPSVSIFWHGSERPWACIDGRGRQQPQPPLAPQPAPTASKTDTAAVAFAIVYEDWFTQKKTPTKRAAAIRSYWRQLAEFLGHDNIKAVTPQNGVAFKKHLLAGNTRTSYTVRTMLSPLKTITKFAVREIYITEDPFEKLTVEGAEAGTRPDFTNAELCEILTAARTAGDLIRWGCWLMGMTGCSNKELFNARKDHFERRDGLVVWNVRGYKTKFRTRSIPLHSSIVAEDFWHYVESLPDGSKLFPMVGGADADKVSVNASQRINEWLEPFGGKTLYSFRHAFKTKLRAAKLPKDERDFYMGHAAGDVAATYGENLATTLSDYIERIPNPTAAKVVSLAA